MRGSWRNLKMSKARCVECGEKPNNKPVKRGATICVVCRQECGSD